MVVLSGQDPVGLTVRLSAVESYELEKPQLLPDDGLGEHPTVRLKLSINEAGCMGLSKWNTGAR